MRAFHLATIAALGALALGAYSTRDAQAQPARQPAAARPTTAAASARFQAFLESLWPSAQEKGVSSATFDAAVAGLTPDLALVGGEKRQPEFERTIQAYLDDATSLGRVARGREAARRYGADLSRIQKTYGVPSEIILAVWGMETDFGRSAGDHDVLRSLATQAFSRADGDTFRDEIIAALVMIEKGDATRARLKGSWAGAMGQPQFLPSAYLKYAVAYNGSGPADIWSSIPDSLASIANFLREQGWKPGLSWGLEVTIPVGFDWRLLDQPFASFAARGFRAADGGPLPGAASGSATLYLPAGAGGPAFLLSDNYWILKQYNNSDSYAMSVATLGDRIAERPPIRGAWPASLHMLDPTDRAELQTLLRGRGFYDGKLDGRFGPTSRDAIHRFQLSVGMNPADGFASLQVLARLREAARR